MHFEIDTETLTLRENGRIFHTFKNVKELIAYLIPSGWQKKDYDQLYMTRLFLFSDFELCYFPAKEFAFINGFTREYIYELAAAGKVDVHHYKGKKLFCFKTETPPDSIRLYTRETGIIEKSLKKSARKRKVNAPASLST